MPLLDTFRMRSVAATASERSETRRPGPPFFGGRSARSYARHVSDVLTCASIGSVVRVLLIA